MAVYRGRRVAIDVTRLGVGIVVFESRLLLRLRLHLVGISLCARRLIRVSCRRTFEAGKLLHPCRERSAAALTICTIWHLCQHAGLMRNETKMREKANLTTNLALTNRENGIRGCDLLISVP